MGAVERAVEVLRVFDARKPILRFSEVVDASGLPKSTVHRTLAQLVRVGLLERDDRGRYVVGLRMFEIGALAPRAYQYRHLIAPYIERAWFEAGADVMLAILDGEEAVLVEHLVGRHPVPLAAGLGERLPLHASAVGHVMLAFGPGHLLDEVCSEPMAAYTPDTITEPDALRAAVTATKQRGFSIVHNGMVAGAVSIAAPIFERGRDLLGALLLIAPSDRARVSQFTVLAAQTAQLASQAIQNSSGSDSRSRRLRR